MLDLSWYQPSSKISKRSLLPIFELEFENRTKFINEWSTLRQSSARGITQASISIWEGVLRSKLGKLCMRKPRHSSAKLCTLEGHFGGVRRRALYQVQVVALLATHAQATRKLRASYAWYGDGAGWGPALTKYALSTISKKRGDD